MEYRQRARKLNAGVAMARSGQGLCGSVLAPDAGDRQRRFALRTLPAAVYSRTNPEEIDDSREQHATDALPYGLTRRKTEFRLFESPRAVK